MPSIVERQQEREREKGAKSNMEKYKVALGFGKGAGAKAIYLKLKTFSSFLFFFVVARAHTHNFCAKTFCCLRAGASSQALSAHTAAHSTIHVKLPIKRKRELENRFCKRIKRYRRLVCQSTRERKWKLNFQFLMVLLMLLIRHNSHAPTFIVENFHMFRTAPSLSR